MLKTFQFWNSSNVVDYFKEKPADYRIKNRLEKIDSKQRNSMNALDLGCGAGRHAELLVNLGFKTSIIDPNPKMLKATTKRVGSRLQSSEKGSMHKLPYSDNSFDVVVATGVLHQARTLEEYERAISELSRVTKPAGIVCLNIFTSKATDPTLKKLDRAFSYKTKEGLFMSLLDKNTFHEIMNWFDLVLEDEISEDVVSENTGPRSVLRCFFIKK